MASEFNIVITVFKTCRRKISILNNCSQFIHISNISNISILNTKYYEFPFEKLRVRFSYVDIGSLEGSNPKVILKFNSSVCDYE